MEAGVLSVRSTSVKLIHCIDEEGWRGRGFSHDLD
jgi:hypothetical protein